MMTTNRAHWRRQDAPAILEAAAAIVFVHSQPSGDPAPSAEDLSITRRLREVGELVGVRVLDVMTNVISNVATAVFMFPVALSISELLGVSFKPFAMTIMVAASCAFVNPAGFQTNLMVQKDGGYTFADFARVGLPLTILMGIVVLLVVPVVYGF